MDRYIIKDITVTLVAGILVTTINLLPAMEAVNCLFNKHCTPTQHVETMISAATIGTPTGSTSSSTSSSSTSSSTTTT